MRLFMLCTRFLAVFAPNLDQTFKTVDLRWSVEWDCLLLAYISNAHIPQRISIGFRSGEHMDHFNTSMWLPENHWEVEKLVWRIALSIWKVYFLRRNLFKKGNKCATNTLKKSLLFIFDEVKKMEEFLGYRKHLIP